MLKKLLQCVMSHEHRTQTLFEKKMSLSKGCVFFFVFRNLPNRSSIDLLIAFRNSSFSRNLAHTKVSNCFEPRLFKFLNTNFTKFLLPLHLPKSRFRLSLIVALSNVFSSTVSSYLATDVNKACNKMSEKCVTKSITVPHTLLKYHS